jgi:Na+:H+ antiporter, NhaA family
MRTRSGDRVAIVSRHFPLVEVHSQAWQLALAAECAAEQGAYQEVRRQIFREEYKSPMNWADFASALSAQDIHRFLVCLQEPETERRVREDLELGRRIGVVGTPTFFLGGHGYGGTQALSKFEELLDASSARADEPAAR